MLNKIINEAALEYAKSRSPKSLEERTRIMLHFKSGAKFLEQEILNAYVDERMGINFIKS